MPPSPRTDETSSRFQSNGSAVASWRQLDGVRRGVAEGLTGGLAALGAVRLDLGERSPDLAAGDPAQAQLEEERLGPVGLDVGSVGVDLHERSFREVATSAGLLMNELVTSVKLCQSAIWRSCSARPASVRA